MISFNKKTVNFMNKRTICNNINFLRGENNKHDIEYMLTPVREQLKLIKKYKLPTTFLLQYDALIDPRFIDLLNSEKEDYIEFGAWFETPKQLIVAAGIEWRGREGYTWDWYNDVGFLIGYTPEERIKIIDTYFEKFREIFGYYPETAGSWHIDAVSLKHMADKYNIAAACECREQVGTDGYTMWGGYEGAYYPSVYNMYAPASSKENQINVPMFRMLGIDLTYNYDHPYLSKYMGFPKWMTQQNTMEPVSKHYGGNREWVEWFLKTQQNSLYAPFSYVQVGQENGFGWENMGEGLAMQLELISELWKQGKLDAEKLSDSGKWFKENFKSTPSVCALAETDWMDAGRKSYWHYSKNYRANLYVQGVYAWIRDIYLFEETYKEHHLTAPCRSRSTIFDNLPVCDGYLWSDEFVRAGIYPVKELKGSFKPVEISAVQAINTEKGLEIHMNSEFGDIEVDFFDFVSLKASKELKWLFRFSMPKNGDLVSVNGDGIDAWNDNISGFDKKTVKYIHGGINYELKVLSGEISADSKDGAILFESENGKVTLKPETVK